MKQFLKTNRIAKLAVFVAPITAVCVFFVNASPVNSLSVNQIVNQSKVLSAKINAPQYSLKTKAIFKKHKITIINYLSAKVLATSCQELKNLDSSILTGLYQLYPNKNLSDPKETLCEFNSAGTLVANKDLSEHFKREPGCETDGSCVTGKDFYKTFECSQAQVSVNKTYCEVAGVFGTPMILTNKNNKCSETTYGYDEALGFWVNSGCSGVFKMNRVPNVEIPMSLLTWKSYGLKMVYRLDVLKTTGPVQEEINGCAMINPDVDQDAAANYEYVFSGICAQNKTANVDATTSVRICGVINGITTHCSAFQPLKVDNILELTFDAAKVPTFNVMGNFERVVNSLGTNRIQGWACAEGFARPLAVNVYAGGAPGAGKLLASQVLANIGSEPAVLARCKVSTGGYRFNIPLTDAEIASVRGQKLYVQAVTPLADTKFSALLPNSGLITLPTAKIIGFVDSAKIENNKVVVRGWACAHGVGTSIWTHIYVNGPAGRGQYLGASQANIANEAAVNDRCATPTGFPHRFIATLPITANIQYNTAVFVHGISPNNIGTENSLIGNSGDFILRYGTPPPPVERRSGSDR